MSSDYDALKRVQQASHSSARGLIHAAITGRNLRDAVDEFVYDGMEQALVLQQLALKTAEATRQAERIEGLTRQFVAGGRRNQQLCNLIAAENKILKRLESEVDHLAAQVKTMI